MVGRVCVYALMEAIMAHRSRTSNKSLSSRPNAAPAAGEYKVGPGCPPREHQFPPGKSGNPNGAKRKEKSPAVDMKKALQAALNKKVKLRQGERERITTMWMAGVDQLMAQFAKGDRHARRDVVFFAEKLGIDLKGAERTQEDLAPDHRAILDAHVKREYDRVVQPPPVFAPPELLDDDAAGADEDEDEKR